MQSNKIKYLLLSAISAAILSGCATTAPSDLPSNVSTVPLKGGQAVEKITYEYVSSKPIDFSYLKLCSAQTIKYDSVRLSDSSGSFVGSYTGNYYNIGSSRTEDARDSIIILDEDKKFIVARGTTKEFSKAFGLTSGVARFIISLEVQDSKLNILFENVEHAQLSTGSISNSGFMRVGTYAGAGFPNVYAAITEVKDSLTSCLSQRGF
jgi:hypothetical protein